MSTRAAQDDGGSVTDADRTRRTHGVLGSMALAWLALDDRSRIIVDRDQFVLWSNAAADLLVTGGIGLKIRDGTLLALDPSRQDDFKAFVAAAGPAESSWCLPCADGDQWLLFRARQFNLAEPRVIGLLLVASEEFRSVYKDLDAAFGLTGAEHRVLTDLLAGNDAGMLAKLHRVSVGTIRAHIRSIYLKLGVGTREQLFHRTQAFQA